MYFCSVKKYYMKLFYTYLSFFFCLILFSQERVWVKGKVYLNEYDEPLTGIYVKNNNTNYTTIVDITGNYTLEAQAGDVILFQGYHIQNRNIMVTPTMEATRMMSIHLDIREKEIADIYVTPFKTYGSIELDVKRIPMMNKTNELLAKLGNLSPIKKLDGSTDLDTEAAKAATAKINIDGIFDLFSGDSKRRERLSVYEGQIKIMKNIREYFGDEYFMGIGLDKSQIDEFILYTYLNHDVKFFYEHNNYFQILNVFDKNVLNYKARKEQTATPSNAKVGEKYFPE